ADSLEEYLSIVLCLRDGFCASSAPIYVDAVHEALGLPVQVEQPIGIGSHHKLVASVGAPAAALRALFDAENASERKSRDAHTQQARDEVVAKLAAFLEKHGVKPAEDPYAVVQRARERHPRFVLHDEK